MKEKVYVGLSLHTYMISCEAFHCLQPYSEHASSHCVPLQRGILLCDCCGDVFIYI